MPVELTKQIERKGPAGVPSDLHGTNDAMLVAEARKGEATAFVILVERHERRILAVARRITRTKEDAEDVVQLAFKKPSSTCINSKGDLLFRHG